MSLAEFSELFARGGMRQRAPSRDASRVEFVDIARALTVCAMIAGAIVAAIPPAHPARPWLAILTELTAPFALPAFFVLAGVFLHRSMRSSLPSFFVHRVAPLVWRYILWTTVGTLIALLFKLPISFAVLLRCVARVLLDPPAMLLVVCVLAVCLALVRLTRAAPALLALPAGAALEICHPDFGGAIPSGVYNLFIYLYIGHVFAPEIRRFARYVARNRRQAGCGLAIWALLNAVAVHAHVPFVQAGSIASLPFASLGFGLAGVAGVIALASLSAEAACAPILRWIGARALGVYFLSFVTIEVCGATMPNVAGYTVLAIFLCALGAGMLALAMARGFASR